MKYLYTVTGPVTIENIKYILPHEHAVLDLSIGPKDAALNEAEAVNKIVPYLAEAKAKGISAIGECSPMHTGRSVSVMKEASAQSGVLIIASTGMYCDPWIPDSVSEMSAVKLADTFIRELTCGMDDTHVKAGFIKVGIFKGHPTEKEQKVMEAACYAAKETGCAILAHAMSYESASGHLEIIKKTGLSYDQYIWAHAHREYDLSYHIKALSLGCRLEYDGIGLNNKDDMLVINLIETMLKKGYGDRILISQDRGWYNPSKLGGGEFRPYTYMTDIYIEKLIKAEIEETYITKLLRDNPFNALKRS